jgi:hypothetical protein
VILINVKVISSIGNPKSQESENEKMKTMKGGLRQVAVNMNAQFAFWGKFYTPRIVSKHIGFVYARCISEPVGSMERKRKLQTEIFFKLDVNQ